jgi:hypothetical protein
LANAQVAGNNGVSPTVVPSQKVVEPKSRAVVDPAVLRGGDQGHPLEITLDEAVEAEPDLGGEGEAGVEYERREEEEEEEEEEELQYEGDYSDELERCSYTPPSDVEVRPRKRSSDELEDDAEADEADRLRGGTPPKRARKGERYAAEDEESDSVKLKLRKRSSEELDDADEDGGRSGGGNKRVRVDDSSPAESPRTSTTATCDVSSLADEECLNRDRARGGQVTRSSRVLVSEVDLDRLYVLADEEDLVVLVSFLVLVTIAAAYPSSPFLSVRYPDYSSQVHVLLSFSIPHLKQGTYGQLSEVFDKSRQMNYFSTFYVIRTDLWDNFYFGSVFAYCGKGMYKLLLLFLK